MPELPEVESVRKGLQKAIIDQKILNIQINNLKIVSSNSNKRIADKIKAEQFEKNLNNKIIKSIDRRAKNIIIEMQDKSIILIHLKMTGQLVYQDNNNNSDNFIGGHPIISSYKEQLPNKHTHIIFTLDKGKLYYNDTRAFGYVLYYNNIDEVIKNNHFNKLGVEPLSEDFTLTYFQTHIQDKKNQNKILKKIFLDQSIVVGIGNIYADEICFASKVKGNNLLKNLTEKQIRDLYNNIKDILKKSIQMGGSSVSDYLLADGSKGNYAREHKVYGKANQNCPICNNLLSKTEISGRTTIYCNNCQK